METSEKTFKTKNLKDKLDCLNNKYTEHNGEAYFDVLKAKEIVDTLNKSNIFGDNIIAEYKIKEIVTRETSLDFSKESSKETKDFTKIKEIYIFPIIDQVKDIHIGKYIDYICSKSNNKIRDDNIKLIKNYYNTNFNKKVCDKKEEKFKFVYNLFTCESYDELNDKIIKDINGKIDTAIKSIKKILNLKINGKKFKKAKKAQKILNFILKNNKIFESLTITNSNLNNEMPNCDSGNKVEYIYTNAICPIINCITKEHINKYLSYNGKISNENRNSIISFYSKEFNEKIFFTNDCNNGIKIDNKLDFIYNLFFNYINSVLEKINFSFETSNEQEDNQANISSVINYICIKKDNNTLNIVFKSELENHELRKIIKKFYRKKYKTLTKCKKKIFVGWKITNISNKQIITNEIFIHNGTIKYILNGENKQLNFNNIKYIEPNFLDKDTRLIRYPFAFFSNFMMFLYLIFSIFDEMLIELFHRNSIYWFDGVYNFLNLKFGSFDIKLWLKCNLGEEVANELCDIIIKNVIFGIFFSVIACLFYYGFSIFSSNWKKKIYENSDNFCEFFLNCGFIEKIVLFPYLNFVKINTFNHFDTINRQQSYNYVSKFLRKEKASKVYLWLDFYHNICKIFNINNLITYLIPILDTTELDEDIINKIYMKIRKKFLNPYKNEFYADINNIFLAVWFCIIYQQNYNIQHKKKKIIAKEALKELDKIIGDSNRNIVTEIDKQQYINDFLNGKYTPLDSKSFHHDEMTPKDYNITYTILDDKGKDVSDDEFTCKINDEEIKNKPVFELFLKKAEKTNGDDEYELSLVYNPLNYFLTFNCEKIKENEEILFKKLDECVLSWENDSVYLNAIDDFFKEKMSKKNLDGKVDLDGLVVIKKFYKNNGNKDDSNSSIDTFKKTGIFSLLCLKDNKYFEKKIEIKINEKKYTIYYSFNNKGIIGYEKNKKKKDKKDIFSYKFSKSMINRNIVEVGKYGHIHDVDFGDKNNEKNNYFILKNKIYINQDNKYCSNFDKELSFAIDSNYLSFYYLKEKIQDPKWSIDYASFRCPFCGAVIENNKEIYLDKNKAETVDNKENKTVICKEKIETFISSNFKKDNSQKSENEKFEKAKNNKKGKHFFWKKSNGELYLLCKDLYDEKLNYLPGVKYEKNLKNIRLHLIGSTNSGKSAFISVLVNKNNNEINQLSGDGKQIENYYSYILKVDAGDGIVKPEIYSKFFSSEYNDKKELSDLIKIVDKIIKSKNIQIDNQIIKNRLNYFSVSVSADENVKSNLNNKLDEYKKFSFFQDYVTEVFGDNIMTTDSSKEVDKDPLYLKIGKNVYLTIVDIAGESFKKNKAKTVDNKENKTGEILGRSSFLNSDFMLIFYDLNREKEEQYEILTGALDKINNDNLLINKKIAIILTKIDKLFEYKNNKFEKIKRTLKTFNFNDLNIKSIYYDSNLLKKYFVEEIFGNNCNFDNEYGKLDICFFAISSYGRNGSCYEDSNQGNRKCLYAADSLGISKLLYYIQYRTGMID